MPGSENFFEGLPPIAPTPQETPEDAFEAVRRAKAVAEAQAKSKPAEPQTVGEYAKDVGGAGAAGIARGAISLPGIVGDLGQLYSRSPAYIEWAKKRAAEAAGYEQPGAAKKAYEAAIKPIEAAMSPEERAGMEYKIPGIPFAFPTGQKIVHGAAQYVPGIEYQGVSAPARVAGAVGEFVGQVPGTGLATGAVRAALKAPQAATKGVTVGRELASSAGAGLTSGLAGEALRGTDDEMAARILGAFPGAMLGRAAAGRFTPGAAKERGQRISGDIIRETEPGVAGSTIPAAGDLAENIRPTTAQVTQSPTMEALERSIARDAGKTQREESVAAMQKAAEGIPDEVRSGSPGVTAPYANPLEVSSEAAQKLYQAVESPARQAMEEAWQHPAFTQGRYNRPAVISALDDAFKQMRGKAATIPPQMNAMVDRLRNFPDAQIPFLELQDLKAYANQILRDPSVDKSAAKAISVALDDVMTNPKNVSHIFMSGVVPGDVAPAFDKARTLTREYKSTFETPTTKPLTERHGPYHSEAGNYVTQPEEFLSKVLKTPDQALAKYRELQGIPGLDMARPIGDWLVTHIQGGKAAITPEMLAKFKTSPSYAALVNEVPGLSQRLDLIAATSKADQIANSLTAQIQGNPTKLADWISKNRADINSTITTPEGQRFVNQLNKSANILKKLPASDVVPETAAKKLKMLADGDLFTLLHGKMAGVIGGAAAGAAAGKVAGMTVPMQIAAEMIGAGAGAAHAPFMTPVTRAVSRIIYGTTKDEAMAALQRAAVDPVFAKFLAQKPSEANAMKLRGLLRESAARAPVSGVAAERLREPEPPQKTTDELYDELSGQAPPLTIRGPGNRMGRATGGAVNLTALAKSARRHVTLDTKPLLGEHDETVARALEVAGKHI